MIVLKRPIITEKSMMLAKIGLYTFEVDKAANKRQVAKAVAEKFSVKVTGVNIMNVRGSSKNQKTVRRSYMTKSFKKAIVKLSKGQILPIFETPSEEVVVTTAENEPIRIKEKKDFLGRTKLKVEQTSVGASPTTQRKVITGK